MEPHQIHPDLSRFRLAVIARILGPVRHQTRKLYDPSAGDTPWDLGCRVYSRASFALEQAQHRHGWLQVDRAQLRTLVYVGEVPMRFWHGDPSKPRGKVLNQGTDELEAAQLAFEDYAPEFVAAECEEDPIWRIAVQADDLAGTARVHLVCLKPSAERIGIWPIDQGAPRRRSSNVTEVVDATREEPRKLPPATLSRRQVDEEGSDRGEPT